MKKVRIKQYVSEWVSGSGWNWGTIFDAITVEMTDEEIAKLQSDDWTEDYNWVECDADDIDSDYDYYHETVYTVLDGDSEDSDELFSVTKGGVWRSDLAKQWYGEE